MKRILSLLLVIFMLFSMLCLASCEEEETSSSSEESSTQSEQARLLSSAIMKNEELDAYIAKMTIRVDVTIGQMMLTIPMTIDMVVENAKSENPVLSAIMTTTMLGQKQTTKVYNDGSWLYLEKNGEGYKVKPEDAGDEYDYVGDLEDIIKDLPEDALSLAGLKIKDDGTVEIAVALADEQFNQLFADAVATAGGTQFDLDGVDLSNGVVKVAIDKEGFIKTYELQFSLEMTVEEQATTANVTAKVEFNGRGEGIKAEPMQGYQAFEEATIEE